MLQKAGPMVLPFLCDPLLRMYHAIPDYFFIDKIYITWYGKHNIHDKAKPRVIGGRKATVLLLMVNRSSDVLQELVT